MSARLDLPTTTTPAAPAISTAPPNPDVHMKIIPRQQGNIMLSRVANSLYWMSRYIERAENVARLLDVNIQILLDFGSLTDEGLEEHWLPILRSAGDEAAFFKKYTTPGSEAVTEFMTFDETNPNSVVACLMAARENARQIRDQISLEMFEIINECYLFLKSKAARELWKTSPHDFYEHIKKYSHLFQGLTDSTFSRNQGFEFIQFGKFLERADKTTRILDTKYHILLPHVQDVGGAVDAAQWQAVLRSVSALESYRRAYVAETVPWKAAQFIIFAETFPRSIRFCMTRVDHYLHMLANTDRNEYNSPEEKAFGKLYSEMNFLHIEDVMKSGLHEYLERVRTVLDKLDDFIYARFIYYPPVDLEAEIRVHQQERQQQQRNRA